MNLQSLLDRAAIREAIESWGLYRDAGRWDQLRALYSADGTMQTSWFDGSAAEFVERSMESARRGTRVQHFIGAATIAVNGNKAIAESRVVILLRAALHGIEVDVTCYARFYDRFVRADARWQISKRVPIYEKDRLDPVNPGSVPILDPAQLARYPEGYRHLAYLQSAGGRPVTPDLHITNGPSLARLYADGASWLNDSDQSQEKR
jgi:SnoaL-like protein